VQLREGTRTPVRFHVLDGGVKLPAGKWQRDRAYLRAGPGVLSSPARSSLRGRETGPHLLPLVSPSAARLSAKSRIPRQTWLFPRRRLRHDTQRQYAGLIGGHGGTKRREGCRGDPRTGWMSTFKTRILERLNTT
jgi:hypothetical protein